MLQLTKEDFDLPTLGPRVLDVGNHVSMGRGFHLVKCASPAQSPPSGSRAEHMTSHILRASCTGASLPGPPHAAAPVDQLHQWTSNAVLQPPQLPCGALRSSWPASLLGLHQACTALQARRGDPRGPTGDPLQPGLRPGPCQARPMLLCAESDLPGTCRGFPVERFASDRLGLVLAFWGLGLALGSPLVSQTDYNAEGDLFGSLLCHVTVGRHTHGAPQLCPGLAGAAALLRCSHSVPPALCLGGGLYAALMRAAMPASTVGARSGDKLTVSACVDCSWLPCTSCTPSAGPSGSSRLTCCHPVLPTRCSLLADDVCGCRAVDRSSKLPEPREGKDVPRHRDVSRLAFHSDQARVKGSRGALGNVGDCQGSSRARLGPASPAVHPGQPHQQRVCQGCPEPAGSRSVHSSTLRVPCRAARVCHASAGQPIAGRDRLAASRCTHHAQAWRALKPPWRLQGATDLIALLSVTNAPSGGESQWVSGVAIHNELLRRGRKASPQASPPPKLMCHWAPALPCSAARQQLPLKLGGR